MESLIIHQGARYLYALSDYSETKKGSGYDWKTWVTVTSEANPELIIETYPLSGYSPVKKHITVNITSLVTERLRTTLEELKKTEGKAPIKLATGEIRIVIFEVPQEEKKNKPDFNGNIEIDGAATDLILWKKVARNGNIILSGYLKLTTGDVKVRLVVDTIQTENPDAPIWKGTAKLFGADGVLALWHNVYQRDDKDVFYYNGNIEIK